MTVTTPKGRLVPDEQGLRLEFVRSFEHPVGQVWAALTEPGRLAEWFGTWTGDPATGTVDLLMGEGSGPAEAVAIKECSRPTRLVVDLPGPDDDVWSLDVTLAEDGGTTTLVFTQRLVQPYDATSIGPGWQFYLDRLAAVVAGAEVPEDWDAYYPDLGQAYATP